MEPSISWTDLSVRIGNKVVLNRLSGEFASSSVNGVMGPSGCGKTSLIKCLNASNKFVLSPESKIFVNKAEPNVTSALICQNQSQRLMTGLTVRQSLTYASKLKNSSVIGLNHSLVVNQVMSELLIEDVGDNRIEKCSGGQLKRLCIGLELTAVEKPRIIFLDEPTTGLDSNAAEVIVQCLLSLAVNHRMCVICSIHQPNHRLLTMFHNIYVLSKDGHQIYDGSPQPLKHFLTQVNIKVTDNEVPIEVLLEYASLGMRDPNVKRMNEKSLKQSEESAKNSLKYMKVTDNGIVSQRKAFQFKEVLILLCRHFSVTLRSKSRQLMSQLLILCLINLFMVSLFDTMSGSFDGCFSMTDSNKTCLEIEDDNNYLRSSASYMGYSIFYMILGQIMLVVPSFIDQYQIFSSEHTNGWYSPGSYFISKTIIDSLLTSIYSLILSLFFYFGFYTLDDPSRLLLIIYVHLATLLCTQVLSSIMSLIMIHAKYLAVSMSMLLIILLITYSNFLMRLSDIMWIQQQISEAVFLKLYFNSMIIIVYGLDRCPPGHMAKILMDYDIEDDEILNSYMIRYLICLLVLLLIEFIVFYLRVNKKFNFIIKVLQSKGVGIAQESPSFVLNNNLVAQSSEIESQPQPRKIMIAWKDTSVVIPIRKSYLNFSYRLVKILDQISGSFDVQTLNALMGPSGAGKTTLLKCLNGKHTKYLSQESKIFVKFGDISRNVFIKQDISEHLLSGLTVRQTLLYASKLKNSITDHKLDHKSNVEELMSELLIADASETRVESCSGGERKLIAIACELTAHKKPNILCIDEPTSGLDSNAAEVVVDCLRKLVRSQRMTVIVSIHQPNQRLLHMFDDIYVLAKGGTNVYSGRPQHLRHYLKECAIDCNENEIPVEMLMKYAYSERKEDIERLALHKRLEAKDNFDRMLSRNGLIRYDLCDDLRKRFLLKDFWLLLKRSMTYSYVSNWKALLFQTVMIILQAIVMRTHFSSEIVRPDGCLDIDFTLLFECNQTVEDMRAQQLVTLNTKYQFLTYLGLCTFIMVFAIISLFGELRVIRNEYRNFWFSSGAFLWSKTIVDILPLLIIMIPFCLIIDMTSDLRMFWVYYSTFIPTIIITQSLAHMSVVVFIGDIRTAMLVSQLVFNFFSLVSNGMIPLKTMHYAIRALSEFNYFKFAHSLITLKMYGFGRCAADQISIVLYAFDITDDMFWPIVSKLLINLVFYKLLTFVIFKVKFDSVFESNRKQLKSEKILKSDII